MKSSGIKWFFRLVFLCSAIGITLIWYKYFRTPTGQRAELERIPPNLTRAIFTPDETCYLLNINPNRRAGEMRKRNYPETELKQDKSLLYNFNFGYPNYEGGWVKFYNHQNFYFVVFDKDERYRNFLSGFLNKKKFEAKDDCYQIYSIGNQCFACDMEFQRETGGWTVMIMKDTMFCKQENRLSLKRKPSGSTNLIDSEPVIRKKKVLEGIGIPKTEGGGFKSDGGETPASGTTKEKKWKTPIKQ